MKNLTLTKFFLIFIFISLVSGCARITEAGKEVWGSSVAHLQRARKDAKAMEFALPYETCFKKTQSILKDAGAKVYLINEKEKYLAAMNFKGYVDTTQVGVFFTGIDNSTTQIEVSSMNPRLAEEVADLLFNGLKG